MHRGLVLGIVALLGIAFCGTGMTLSGFYMQEVYLDFEDGGFEEFIFDTEVGIEASFGEWTTGIYLDFESDGWEDLEVFSSGTLGAFSVFSWLEFYAIDGHDLYVHEVIQDWDTVVQVEVSSVDLWWVFSIISVDTQTYSLTASGIGSAFGLHTQIGAANVYAEFSFNLDPFAIWVVWNGMDTVLGKIQACNLINIENLTCAPTFSAAEFFVLFPFCGVDVGAFFGIAHDGDFAFSLWTEDLQTPLDWLVIDAVELWYYPDEKLMDFTLDFSVGDALCITPFIELGQGFPAIAGEIYLDGLQVVCPIGDVVVAASALTDNTDFFIGRDARIHPRDGDVAMGAVIMPECIRSPTGGADFAIGIETGGSSCCAPFEIGVYAYFESGGHNPLFDLQRIRFEYRDGIGEKLSWSLVAIADHNEFEGIEIILNYEWGDVQLVSNDESCCAFVP